MDIKKIEQALKKVMPMECTFVLIATDGMNRWTLSNLKAEYVKEFMLEFLSSYSNPQTPDNN